MPIPAGVEQVTVTDGDVPLTGPDGTVLAGSFTVAGPDLATVKEDDYLFGGFTRRWVTAGRFDPVTLVATDATGIDPAGFTYTIVFTPRYGTPWTRYFQLPKAAPSVVLADILIPDPVAGSYTVLADASTLLAKAANLSDIADPATARDNLGLGNAAVADVGTTAGTVAAGTTAAVLTEHTAADDPHGYKTWADNKFATQTALNATNTNVTTVSASVSQLDTFVQDCLTRVAAIEQGTAFLAALNVAGPAQVSNGNLTITDFTKGYRFRIDGSSLDLEATGKDLITSVWSGSGFNGTQHAYDRYASDADAAQHAGRREYVTALYGAAVHAIDPATGVAALGAKNGLANIRLAGFQASPGAPTTGAWAAGDVVLDSAGAWHLCTAPGSPGTWT